MTTRYQLALALTNKTGKNDAGVDLKGPAKKESKHIVEEFGHGEPRTRRSTWKRSMRCRSSRHRPGRSPEQIGISSAQHLEGTYTQSENALDELFARTYNGIKDGRRTLKSRALDGDNIVGSVNQAGNDIDNTVIDSTRCRR